MLARQLINRAEDVVEETVEGMLLVHPSLTRLSGMHVILARDYAAIKARQVTLLSGGGSGHEPSHGGWVGAGMLTCAVAGGVFASPSVHSILSGIRAVAGPHGCLVIVKNYTGDRLNFGLAIEQAKSEGLSVEMVIVGDDCGITSRPEDRIAGRRGLAGTVLVHKIAGAAACGGAALDAVAAAARAVAESVGTVGVALDVCTLPGKAKDGARLGVGEMEIGLGIHGEPGASKTKLAPVDAIVDAMLALIRGSSFLAVGAGDRVALVVNNLGATPTMQLYVAARRAVLALEADGVAVERVYVGSFMTALDMQGCSISLLKLDAQSDARAAQLARLDGATSAPAWPAASSALGAGAASSRTAAARDARAVEEALPAAATALASAPDSAPLGAEGAAAWRACVRGACAAILAGVAQLTEWDRVCGDGDCGDTFERGARELLRQLDDDAAPPCAWLNPAASAKRALLGVADTIRESMGGTSGVVLDIFFRALATNVGARHHKGRRAVAGECS